MVFKTLVNLNYFVKLYDKTTRKKIGMSLNKIFFLCTFLFLIDQETNCFLKENTFFEKTLCCSQIENCERLQDFFGRQNISIPFTNDVYLMQFCNQINAIFKPAKDEDVRYAYAEVAAYKASLWLGFPCVPPTVLRQIDDVWGSVQLYIQGDHDLVMNDLEQEAAYKIFCFIFGQWDVCKSNRLVYKNKENQILVAIDNANIADRQKCRYGEHPYICVWAKDDNFYDDAFFSFDNRIQFENPTQEELYDFFISFMPAWKAKRLSTRLSKRSIVSCIKHYDTLWLQALENELPFSDMIPSWCLKKISALNKQAVKSFFADAPEGLFADAFFDDIIDRQRQVLAYFYKNK